MRVGSSPAAEQGQVVRDGVSVQLSVVIPVFNEEENLVPLVEELEKELTRLEKSYEIIFVNDTSTDRSLEVLRKLREERPRLRIICHRQNCGESAALGTGFGLARGEVVVTMDGDCQNDPADITRLLGALAEDVACVCSVRRVRNDSWVKRISSRIANRFRNLITGDQIADAGCTFRAVRRAALREVPVFNGMHRFLPTILRAQKYRVVEIQVNHRPRTKGVSKYGVGNRLWRGIRDCFAMRWYQGRAVPGDRIAGEEN